MQLKYQHHFDPNYSSTTVPAVAVWDMDRAAQDYIQNLMVLTQDGALRDLRGNAGARLAHWDSAKGVAYVVMTGNDPDGVRDFIDFITTHFLSAGVEWT